MFAEIERLFQEFRTIFNGLHVERAIRSQNRLPTYNEYRDYRPGTNLMGAICALTE